MASDSVTIIGLGPMGSAMAHAMLDAGHDVTVWNRTPDRAAGLIARGAYLAGSPAAAIAASPITVISLRSYRITDEVLATDGVAAAIAGKAIVQVTTAATADAPPEQAWVHHHGGRFLAGGVFSYPDQIGRDDNIIYYGGDADVFEAHGTTLSAIAGDHRYLGEDVRAGLAAYGTSGGFALCAIGAFLETSALARNYGIGIDAYHDMCRHAMSVVFDRIANSRDRIVENNYAPDDSSVESTREGVREFCDEFTRLGVPALAMHAHLAQLDFLYDRGHGDKDLAYLAEALWQDRLRPTS